MEKQSFEQDEKWITNAYRQNPWISDAKTHGKAGTLQGESWLHYLKGKKREKGGEVGIGMPLLFEFEKVTEYLAYFNSFSYMKQKSRIALDWSAKRDKNEKFEFIKVVNTQIGSAVSVFSWSNEWCSPYITWCH